MESYVLVSVNAGRAGEIASRSKALDHVRDAQLVLGSTYDVIVEVATETYAEAEALIREIRNMPGVEGVAACEGFQVHTPARVAQSTRRS